LVRLEPLATIAGPWIVCQHGILLDTLGGANDKLLCKGHIKEQLEALSEVKANRRLQA